MGATLLHSADSVARTPRAASEGGSLGRLTYPTRYGFTRDATRRVSPPTVHDPGTDAQREEVERDR